jgi:DNA-binding NtrC family response regulator
MEHDHLTDEEAPSARVPPRVLVVDDEEIILRSCRKILERRGFEVTTEQNPFSGRDRALRGAYSVVLLDIRMPDLDGMEILARIREHRSDVEVIIITGYSTIEAAVKAMRLGAFDFVPKPFTPPELVSRVEAALEQLGRLNQEAAARQKDGARRWRMIGESQAMSRVLALIAKIAPSDATVLIMGESGTGKELAAMEIHQRSSRRDRPLVSLDCSALAPGLLESELFGHIKGSFSGATATKPGLFEVASRGTLFLDEVSNMSLDTQGKLLRVLETGEIKPVGGVETRKVDIRLIAATNQELADLVEAGAFRQDLYYRLNVIPIHLPPLRERPEDISPLLYHFLAQYRRSSRPDVRGPRQISSNALERLMHYRWPGNVRELRNLVERLVVTLEAETIRARHLPDYILPGSSGENQRVPRTNQELKEMKKRFRERMNKQLERSFVIEALRRNDWNVTHAARETGMLRPNFHALMRKYDIRAEDHKT